MTTVQIAQASDLASASIRLGVRAPRPVLVLVGAADSLHSELAERLRPLVSETLLPVLVQCGAVVIDGGTDSGVMALIGEARRKTGADCPLLGVAATGTLAPPAGNAATGASLNPDHSGHLLVPGNQWGDEIPWMNALANTIAGDAGLATLAIGGGAITERDIAASLADGRPTLMVTETGPLADRLSQEPRTRLRMIPLAQAADRLARELPLLLRPPRTNASGPP